MRNDSKELNDLMSRLSYLIKKHIIWANQTEREDLVQESLIRIHNGLPTVRGVGDREFINWSLRVAANVLRNHCTSMKRLKRRAEICPAHKDDYSVNETYYGVTYDTPEDDAMCSEYISKHMSTMPCEFLEAFTLQCEGYSYEEIAGKLGVATGTVKSRINRARKHMTEAMAE